MPRRPRDHGGSGPIWTRDFTLATVTNLLLAVVFMSSIVTMAPYAVRDLGASEPQAGAVASIFVVGALLTRPLAGRFLDVIGRKRIVILGIGLQVLAAGLYLLADSLALVLAVRVLHGMAFGFTNTALAASVISLLPPRRRSEGTGYFGMSGVIAGAIGPLFGVPVLMGAGPQMLFIIFTLIVVAAFGMSLLLRLPVPTRPAGVAGSSAVSPPRRSIGPVLRTLLEPTVIPVASVMLVAGAAFASVMTYLSLYTPQLGMAHMTTVFFVVYSASVLLVRPFAGRLHDARGDNTIIYPALLSLAAALAVISIARSPAVLLLGAVLLALGFGTLMSSMQAIAVTLAPAHRVGTATATFFLVLDIGTGLGPILLGFAVVHLGYSPMYLVMAGVALAAVALYHLTHGRTPKRRVGPLPDHLPDLTAPEPAVTEEPAASEPRPITEPPATAQPPTSAEPPQPDRSTSLDDPAPADNSTHRDDPVPAHGTTPADAGPAHGTTPTDAAPAHGTTRDDTPAAPPDGATPTEESRSRQQHGGTAQDHHHRPESHQ